VLNLVNALAMQWLKMDSPPSCQLYSQIPPTLVVKAILKAGGMDLKVGQQVWDWEEGV